MRVHDLAEKRSCEPAKPRFGITSNGRVLIHKVLPIDIEAENGLLVCLGDGPRSSRVIKDSSQSRSSDIPLLGVKVVLQFLAAIGQSSLKQPRRDLILLCEKHRIVEVLA